MNNLKNFNLAAYNLSKEQTAKIITIATNNVVTIAQSIVGNELMKHVNSDSLAVAIDNYINSLSVNPGNEQTTTTAIVLPTKQTKTKQDTSQVATIESNLASTNNINNNFNDVLGLLKNINKQDTGKTIDYLFLFNKVTKKYLQVKRNGTAPKNDLFSKLQLDTKVINDNKIVVGNTVQYTNLRNWLLSNGYNLLEIYNNDNKFIPVYHCDGFKSIYDSISSEKLNSFFV